MTDEAPRKKRGGWCPICEAEGKDPAHKYSSILCPMHYMRQRRATEVGHQQYVQYYQRAGTKRKRERKLGIKKGWCPECEAEDADDPRHSDATILCAKHHSRRYRQTEAGRESTRRLNSGKSRSPIVKAVKKSQQAKENEEKNGDE